MHPFTSHIRKFVPLSSEEEIELLGCTRSITVKKKTQLLKEGDICRSLYFVSQGLLRMYFIGGKGNEQIVQFAKENWWLCDYFSYERQEAAAFHIQAIENSELIAIDYDQYDVLLQKIPQMERYFRIMFQRSTAAAQVRMKHQAELSREEIYRFFNNAFPEFVQRVPQYMLASYLGLTPEYLSEIRKKKL
jgi:CRP-like cAMP-binding protein